MRLLHVINSLSTGGAERLVIEALPLYQSKLKEVDLLVLQRINSQSEVDFCKTFKGEIFFLTDGSVYNPLLIHKIMRFLKKYDLIHIHLFPALYWTILAKLLCRGKVAKFVYTEHSTNNRRRESLLFKYLDKLIYSKLSIVGAISEATKRNLEEHLLFGNDNIIVINNGINLTKFSVGDGNQRVRNHSALFTVIQVANFRPQKDQITLISALSYLPDNIRLVLVGDGELRKTCEEYAVNIGIEDRVNFLGIRDDIPNLMMKSDICVLSSNVEGFGLAIVEGMAMKKPCVASNIEGVSEIVRGYGILFERGNSKELAEIIKKLYEDRVFYDLIATKCLSRSYDYDINNMVDKYIEVYKKIM